MRSRTLTAVIVTSLAALLGSTASATALVPGPAARPASVIRDEPVREGSPSSAVDEVADFYAAYIDAHTGEPDTTLFDALRSHYLTQDFRQRLAEWEQENGEDGVFRSQNTPVAWQVTYDNSGAGHVFTQVRLAWGDEQNPTYTYLSVQSDSDTKLISDIQESSAPMAR